MLRKRKSRELNALSSQEQISGINQKRQRRQREVLNATSYSMGQHDEEKLLKLAIRNSLAEQSSCLDDIDKIEPMKEFRPTAEEFKEPIAYIEKIYKQGGGKLGCIKIIPPKEYKTPFTFNTESDRKLPTRF